MKTKEIKLTILSAQQIPNKHGDTDIVDPYVQVKLYSTAFPDQPQLLFKTEVVENNGLNPIWNKQHIFKVNEQEINMLVISVHDDDKSLLCWNALSVDCLSQGMRAIEMRVNDFCILKGTSILCKVAFL